MPVLERVLVIPLLEILRIKSLIKVIIFEFFILFLAIISWLQKPLGNYPDWLEPYELPLDCIIVATIGGVMYCLRAIYLERECEK